MLDALSGPDAAAEQLGVWRCGHGPCPVSLMLLRLRGGVAPPPLRCPLCLRRLTFGGWLAQPVANCRSPASPRPGTM